MDVELLQESYSERAYGKVEENYVVTGLRVACDNTERVLDAHSRGKFQHKNGSLLNVDANVFYGEPHITVETAPSESQEYQQWTFDSVTRLAQWMTKNATLISSEG